MGDKVYILIFLLAGFVFSSNAFSQEYAKASSLKTLFTTSLERQQLDKLRNSGAYDQKKEDVSGSVVLRPPLKVEMKGLMIREKSQPVVWINQGNTLKSSKIDQDIKVNVKNIKQESLKVPVRVNSKYLTMRPGQQWNESENKVKDKYQIKESNPAPDGVD